MLALSLLILQAAAPVATAEFRIDFASTKSVSDNVEFELRVLAFPKPIEGRPAPTKPRTVIRHLSWGAGGNDFEELAHLVADAIGSGGLDTDYDGRSLFPSQVFFPMAGAKDGWAKLARNLKAEIDEERIEAFRGTESLPFKPGKQIAVKIIDDRGIESFRIIRL